MEGISKILIFNKMAASQKKMLQFRIKISVFNYLQSGKKIRKTNPSMND